MWLLISSWMLPRKCCWVSNSNVMCIVLTSCVLCLIQRREEQKEMHTLHYMT
jgi:hypothetical protein